MVKLIYLSSSTIPSRSANSIHVMKMCQAFSRLGFEVILLAPNREGKEAGVTDPFKYYGVEDCFRIKELPCPKVIKGRTFLYSLLAACYCKINRAELVHSRDLFGALLSCLLGIKTIYETHSPIERNNLSIFYLAFKFMSRSKFLQKMVVISSYLETFFNYNFESLRGKILLCADGADPISEEDGSVKLSQSSDKLQVGYLGHLYAGRGIEVIIQIAQRTPGAEYHLIGGTKEDVRYWKMHTDNLPNVHFHGFVDPGELCNYITSFHVLLAPYQRQVSVAGGGGNTVKWMSPLKIFEYMAAGKIILASRLPALQEVLEEDIDCLMADPDNLDEWIDKIIYIQDHYYKMESLGVTAMKKLQDKYTWKSRAERIIKSL